MTAATYVEQGYRFLERSSFDNAIESFSQALALDHLNVHALAGRGIALAIRTRNTAAQVDIDRALALDPRNALALRAQGLIAYQKGQPSDAVASFTQALEIEPKHILSLYYRALAYGQLEKIDLALADAAAVLKREPTILDLYPFRARLLRKSGRRAEALAEAKKVVSIDPGNPQAHILAGEIFDLLDRPDEAEREFSRAIEIKPTVDAYLARLRSRQGNDWAGRSADVSAGLTLDPKNTSMRLESALLKDATGDFADALEILESAIKDNPTDPGLLVQRGIQYARLGKSELAEADYVSARSHNASPNSLSYMCYQKAIADLSLESALADCDAAIAKAPRNSSALKNRGFALLRLGRYSEAIAAFDKALSIDPEYAEALYGRAVAEARSGLPSKANIDLQAALTLDKTLSDTFERHGLALPD